MQDQTKIYIYISLSSLLDVRVGFTQLSALSVTSIISSQKKEKTKMSLIFCITDFNALSLIICQGRCYALIFRDAYNRECYKWARLCCIYIKCNGCGAIYIYIYSLISSHTYVYTITSLYPNN